MTKPLPNPWSADGVRLTLFPLVQLQGLDTITKMWRGIAGGAVPDETTSKAMSASHLVHGAFGNGRLLVATQPGRIDVHYTVEPQPAIISPNILGPADDVLRLFQERTTSLLTDVPAMHRLAFGGIFVQPAESRQAGYRALSQYLPSLTIDVDNTSDLLYQVNRPRASVVIEGMQINRLTKWSVQGIMALQFTEPAVGLAGLPNRQPSAVHAIYSPRLEADMSTVANGQELPASKLAGLLAELIDLTHEIAVKGDIQ